MSKPQFFLGILQIFLCGFYFAHDYLFLSFILCGTGVWILCPALEKKDPPVIK
jgi:hypothetical protein